MASLPTKLNLTNMVALHQSERWPSFPRAAKVRNYVLKQSNTSQKTQLKTVKLQF